MSLGFSKKVLMRLCELFKQMHAGKKRSILIMNLYGGDKRLFSADFAKLKRAGIRISYSRKRDNYRVENWPEAKTFSFRFAGDEFFYIFVVLSQVGIQDVHKKLSLALSDESDAVFDTGPAYGISQNITGEIAATIDTLKEAIIRRRKLVLRYHSLSSGASNRVVHPCKLVHTPISWYLIAWCEKLQSYWKFKVARISEVTPMKDKFRRRDDFDLGKIIGDAWWIWSEPDKKPLDVKILFMDDAAQAIREYKFHKSQKLESVPGGTLATWRLSSLDEFACWLLQWLGNIKIIEPEKLKNMVSEKIKRHLKSETCPPLADLKSEI